MSGNAIETLAVAVGCAHPVTGDEHAAVDAAPDALAAVEALLEAAKAITLDPEFPGRGPLEITRGQKENLAAAVRRVETGQ